MIVVDASVVANAVADDGLDGEAVRARLRTVAPLVAPDLVDIETASVLRRRWLAGTLTEERLASAVDDLLELPIRRVPVLALVARALELRSNLTPYDGVYVALAEALGCTLLTADRRLANAPGVRCATEVLPAS